MNSKFLFSSFCLLIEVLEAVQEFSVLWKIEDYPYPTKSNQTVFVSLLGKKKMWRQGLTLQPQLAWNPLCSPCKPIMHVKSPVCLSSAVITIIKFEYLLRSIFLPDLFNVLLKFLNRHANKY